MARLQAARREPGTGGIAGSRLAWCAAPGWRDQFEEAEGGREGGVGGWDCRDRAASGIGEWREAEAGAMLRFF
jgi:hypothetical protein